MMNFTESPLLEDYVERETHQVVKKLTREQLQGVDYAIDVSVERYVYTVQMRACIFNRCSILKTDGKINNHYM